MKAFMNEQESLFIQLAHAVAEMEEERAILLAKEILIRGLDPMEAVESGLRAGMEEAGKRFEDGRYFIPEILVCADAMEAAFSVLKPHIKPETEKQKHAVVIGTVEGDTHDLGKNMVALFLSAAGYEVFDLGRNVTAADFADKALEVGADVIALSALMTTAMDRMGDVIALLKKRGVRDHFKVIVGGKPVSPEFSRRIGADGYSADAAGALRLVRRLISDRK